MKVFGGIFVIFQIFSVCALAKRIRIPSYIKPCSKSVPDFEQCCLEHGMAALPFIIKGDKAFGLPNMLPLILPQVKINAGNNLKIELTEVQVHGLDKAELKQVKIDTENKKITLKVFMQVLELLGKYKIDGKIMILPITGNGDMNITALGGEYQYNMEYGLEELKGKQYLELTDKDKLDFNLQGVKINLDNLFNGDKKLGDHMNNFLNENWKVVLNEFGLAISETVRSIGKSIASAYFKRIPYQELILD